MIKPQLINPTHSHNISPYLLVFRKIDLYFILVENNIIVNYILTNYETKPNRKNVRSNLLVLQHL